MPWYEINNMLKQTPLDMQKLKKADGHTNMDPATTQMIANAISTITIVSCLFLKVPQIRTMMAKRTTEGMYVQAMLLEITGFTIVTLYNIKNHYSLMTYMEYPIILIQVFVMLYLTLKYNGHLSNRKIHLAVVAYVGLVTSFLVGISPKEILACLLPFCTPLSGFAKVTYIYGMVQTKNADAVSLTTWCISVLTNMARLFTVYVDSRDITLMINFLVSSTLSAAVFATAFYYQQGYGVCYHEAASSEARRRRSLGPNRPVRKTYPE